MARTRTILIKETSSKKLQFSVNPSEITISESRNATRENIDTLGDVNIPGKRGLKEVSINTFIPHNQSPFYSFKSIKAAIKLLERWIKLKRPLRFITTKPSLNFKVILISKSITLKEGDKDIYISLVFSEYKDMNIRSVESIKGLIEVKEPKLKERAADSAPSEASSRSEVVTSKTTLWGLAVKYYQDGSQWKKIQAANDNINPKKLQEGMVLNIP